MVCPNRRWVTLNPWLFVTKLKDLIIHAGRQIVLHPSLGRRFVLIENGLNLFFLMMVLSWKLCCVIDKHTQVISCLEWISLVNYNGYCYEDSGEINSIISTSLSSILIYFPVFNLVFSLQNKNLKNIIF